jgi:tRNA1Val (adenine37-N6)-methyltransferase
LKRTLLGTDLWILQEKDQAFNLDTILLQDFIRIPKKTQHILDFGTGTGPLMLYLSQKTRAKITGFEIQENRYQQAQKNIELNQLESQVSCILKDINELTQADFKDVDLIVSNPPFFKINEHQKRNLSTEKTIARHEIALSLEQLISKVSTCLKYGGSFQMIHRPDRLTEIIQVMGKYQLEIKRLKMVHPYINQKANHVLIEAQKNAQPGMIIEAPLILYDDKELMSEALKNIYKGDV